MKEIGKRGREMVFTKGGTLMEIYKVKEIGKRERKMAYIRDGTVMVN